MNWGRLSLSPSFPPLFCQLRPLLVLSLRHEYEPGEYVGVELEVAVQKGPSQKGPSGGPQTGELVAPAAAKAKVEAASAASAGAGSNALGGTTTHAAVAGAAAEAVGVGSGAGSTAPATVTVTVLARVAACLGGAGLSRRYALLLSEPEDGGEGGEEGRPEEGWPVEEGPEGPSGTAGAVGGAAAPASGAAEAGGPPCGGPGAAPLVVEAYASAIYKVNDWLVAD